MFHRVHKDDEERGSLLPSSSRKLSNSSSGLRGGRTSTIAIFVILSLLVTGTMTFLLFVQNDLHRLSSQLSIERSNINTLRVMLTAHDTVIDRFNSSVTNSDVLKRLERFELNFTSMERKIKLELVDVKRSIDEQLNQTLNDLSTTVAAAEQQIGLEVDKVKADVDQYVVSTQAQFSMENSFMIYQLAGTFTLLSCLISMWHMTSHLRNFNQPTIQRKILAILWMTPIYAITSWFSLVFPAAEGYLAIIKDGYEAYVIYQFLAFCIAVLGKGNRGAVVDILSTHADHLTPPFRLFGCFEICGCCVPKPFDTSRALADAILLQCQIFVLQFVFFRPFTTTGMVICNQLHYFGGATDGVKFDYRAPQLYLTIVQNISIFVAFSGLLKFYHAVDEELAWCRPFAKFLCIKGVVFMTFWQGLAISVLAEMTDVGGDDVESWAKRAQNFLICLEMLLFSIAHFYCFPTDEWEDGYKAKHSKSKFLDSLALNDFLQDLKLILRSNAYTGHKSLLDKRKMESMEPHVEEEVQSNERHDNNTASNSIAAETIAYTRAPNIDLSGTERAVAEALENALGAAADDPDIIEATKRLLESKVLTPEFFDLTDSQYCFSDDDEDDRDTERDASDEEFSSPSETSRLVQSCNGGLSPKILEP